MFQNSDSFQVFVKADCVIHKTISSTEYRRPRIPFITYLHFQTAHPTPANPRRVKALISVSDNLGRRLAASFGVIGYRSDSVKPKITKKHIFYNFSTISRFHRNHRPIVQNTSFAIPSSKSAICIYSIQLTHPESGQPCQPHRQNTALPLCHHIGKRLCHVVSKMILVPLAEQTV